MKIVFRTSIAWTKNSVYQVLKSNSPNIGSVQDLGESGSKSETLAQVQPIVDRLSELHNLYLPKNAIIASAIFIALAHIKSYYSDDPDAKLVHNLTGLHIHSPIQWLEGGKES